MFDVLTILHKRGDMLIDIKHRTEIHRRLVRSFINFSSNVKIVPQCQGLCVITSWSSHGCLQEM